MRGLLVVLAVCALLTVAGDATACDQSQASVMTMRQTTYSSSMSYGMSGMSVGYGAGRGYGRQRVPFYRPFARAAIYRNNW